MYSGHNLKLTILTDEIRHEHIQVDIYKYIRCLCTDKIHIRSWGLHVSQEAECTICILSYIEY